MKLVLVDTSQIQFFIFGSNRLRENAGASFLVSQATEAWPVEIIKETESSGKKIYSGGGNVLIEFDDAAKATAFIRKLSEKVIEEAPGLQIAFARQTRTDDFYADYQALQKQLREKKRSGKTSVPLLGLGVTRRCQSTGLPANWMTSEKKGETEELFPASWEVIVKNEMGQKRANERLEEILAGVSGGGQYEFPRQLDNLGRSEGEHSYIAVVHIDGDGMGQRIQDLIAAKPAFEDAKANLKKFSDNLKTIGTTALANVLEKLVMNVEVRDKNGSKEWVISHKVQVKDRDTSRESKLREIAKITLNKNTESGKIFLPFRPIIFGGDDLTFVSDGRLGIALAIEFMQEFEKLSKKKENRLPDDKDATVCAGIAIVKVHYPFARAYGIAEELCRNAKDYQGGCFDWHFALSGLSGELKEIREREYTAHWQEGNKPPLYLRPYALDPNSTPSYRSWSSLEKLIAEFQNPDTWLERRNKMKALNEALRCGPKEVEWFLKKYEQGDLPEAKGGLPDWISKGWGEEQCPYFDALELADWYIPLEVHSA